LGIGFDFGKAHHRRVSQRESVRDEIRNR
jgi:hypothetical protein